jgi:hypothetical protein
MKEGMKNDYKIFDIKTFQKLDLSCFACCPFILDKYEIPGDAESLISEFQDYRSAADYSQVMELVSGPPFPE